jgi:hypothetical protein
MVLYNELIVGKLYPKRTKYDFWKDICVGDRLIIGITISSGPVVIKIEDLEGYLS